MTAGQAGLLVVGVLGLVTALLIRSMSKRIKRLPTSFPDQHGARAEPQDRP